MGATALIDGLRDSAAPTITQAPAVVETVGAHAAADLGHGWTLTTRSDTVCLRAPDDADDGSCSVDIGEANGRDYSDGAGVIGWYGNGQSPTLLAWQVPAETSTTLVTAEDGWRLPADVYALADVSGARLAVVFVEDDIRFWLRPDPRVTSYDATGAVVADWPIRDFPAIQDRATQTEGSEDGSSGSRPR